MGRSLTLSYGNCATWSGFAATDQLCRVTYPGGVQTEIGYVATGLPDGSHEFSKTLKEHEAAVRRYLVRYRQRNSGR